MVSKIQFWSVNHTRVTRICKNNTNDKAKEVYIKTF